MKIGGRIRTIKLPARDGAIRISLNLIMPADAGREFVRNGHLRWGIGGASLRLQDVSDTGFSIAHGGLYNER